jgi:GTP-binding protein YchF
MQLGIIGLPTSGKTTLFNALTGSDQPTRAASSGKMEVHAAAVNVPDPRLDNLADLLGPPRRVAAQITYVDIGGLGGSERGSGLSGQLRNQLEQMDGLMHVVRAFEDPTVAHLAGGVDPQRDLETLDEEFVLADLMLVENRLERIREEMGKGKKGDRAELSREQATLERLRAVLEEGFLLRDESLEESELDVLRGYGLLTLKPVIVVLNMSGETRDPSELVSYDHARSTILTMRGRLEMEIAQLDAEDAAEFMAEYGLEELVRQRVIRESYALLGLQTFFTFNEDEVRAWSIPVGATAVEAAEAVHSDIARGFIRAEVAHYDLVVEESGWSELKAAGKLRVEGKDYVMQDGDVMLVRFNV